MASKQREERWRVGPSGHGDFVRLMARADGYVMVRHSGCIPFVITEREWDALPPERIHNITSSRSTEP